MVLVENAGLFAPVDADTLAQVPQDYQAASGKWVGVAARSTVFAYNKTKLKADQLPKSLLDLADPSWKGRWAASPSGADFQAIVSALLQLKGEAATADWLKAMKENFTAYKGNSTVMKAVNAGEIEGGVIYHYYYFGDQAKTGENSKNVALHYFKNQDPGAFVSVSGGGVLASSKHPKEAQAFLKWVTGKGGQEVLKNGNLLRIRRRQGRRVQPEAGAAGRSAGAEGRRRDAELQEGHRPDDGSRLALVPFVLIRTSDRAPAGLCLPRERFVFEMAFVDDDTLRS